MSLRALIGLEDIFTNDEEPKQVYIYQLFIRRKFLTAKFPFGDNSLRRNFPTVKIPYGEKSEQRNLRTVKFPYGEKSYGEKS